MRIALFAARLPPANDGVGDHADIVARALAAMGDDVVTFAAGDSATPVGYTIERVGSTWNASATACALRALREGHFDAAIVEYTPFFFGVRSPAPLAVLVAARALGIRSAVVVHEAFYPAGTYAVRQRWKARVLSLRDAATIAAANVIAAPSLRRAATISAHLPWARGRIVMVPIGANIEPQPGDLRDDRATAPSIVSFGVVSPRRRLELGIAAVEKLVAAGADVRLDVIGRMPDDAYPAQLTDLALQLGIRERVHFHGELPRADVTAMLRTATVAIHTVAEGSTPSSGSLLALLAHGVPTVALRTPYDDAVFDGAVAVAADESQLAVRLQSLLGDLAARRTLGAAAAACYAENFSWTTVAGRLRRSLDVADHDRRRAGERRA